MSNRVVQLSLSLLIGLVIGVLVGRGSAPSTPDRSADPAARSTPPETSIGSVTSLVKQVEGAIETEAGEGLAAVGGILGAATLSDMLDWSRAPEHVSRRIINEMSDDELLSTITSITKITAEDLREYSDLRNYANRLTHIALSGVITPGLGEEFDHAGDDVTFSTGASSASGASAPRRDFEETTRKIYAVIPNDEQASANIMVHWYRTDQPENLLFDQYRVSPADEFSFVWLKSPAGGWDVGEYRVEFYSADELLAPIASGTYTVVAD